MRKKSGNLRRLLGTVLCSTLIGTTLPQGLVYSYAFEGDEELKSVSDTDVVKEVSVSANTETEEQNTEAEETQNAGAEEQDMADDTAAGSGESESGLDYETDALAVSENTGSESLITDDEGNETTDDSKKDAEKNAAVSEGSDELYGTAEVSGMLINGDFTSTDGWELTGFEVTTDEWMPDAYKDQNYLYKWTNAETEASASQTITDLEPGTYTLSVDAGGVYTADTFSLKAVSAEGSILTEKKLEAGTGWGAWTTTTTEPFTITAENNSEITVSVSGTIGRDGSEEQIHIDNVVLASYGSEEPEEITEASFRLYYYTDAYPEEDLGIFGWGGWTGITSTGSELWSSRYEGAWVADKDIIMNRAESDGWFYADLTIDPKDENAGFEIKHSSDASTIISIAYQWNNTDMYAALISGAADTYYIKDGALKEGSPFDDKAAYDDLLVVVSEGERIYKTNKDKEVTYYTTGDYEQAWLAFIDALTLAKEKAKAFEEGTIAGEEAFAELTEAKAALDTAIQMLTPRTAKSDVISVERVNVDSDFMMGADLSSYISLKESGVEFKDEEGNPLTDSEFFEYLYEGGTNWARIRVWNDPYDGSGHGYGGGNNDLDKAIRIGRLATNAGMRVLIDFHYSDFWADPGKQEAPKAWSDYSLEEKENAVYSYTLESLKALGAAGVDVGMVQIGNETNNGICGESSWANMGRIFKKGAEAVRAYDSSVLIAVHFTNPEKGTYSSFAKNLENAGVDYDVFASSYYPMWHQAGSDSAPGHLTDNLKAQLQAVASGFGKKVMVAETSWPTTWDDGDGHGNSAPKTSGQDLDYNISVQGQADEVRDVVAAVASVSGGIGVFYWEPAWLSANYAYNSDGSLNSSAYDANKALWEKYGSGWASSYASEYDPADAGKWYGGSAVDNQAWFDFDGTALATAKLYSYIRSGAEYTGSVDISSVTSNILYETEIGSSIDDAFWSDVAAKATVLLTDGSTFTGADENVRIKWDEDEAAVLSTGKTGTFTVTGKLSVTFSPSEGESATRTYDITLQLSVVPAGEYNLLSSPGFEGDNTAWVSNADFLKPTNDDPHSGSRSAHFWDAGTIEKAVISQEVKGLAAGTYILGTYLQGGSAGDKDYQYLFAQVRDSDGNDKLTYRQKCQLTGYLNWQNPEISAITLSEGDTLTVGMEINSTENGAWGTIDDFYLYGTYPVKVAETQHGSLSVSTYEAMSGSVISVEANPESGYAIQSITVSGSGVKKSTLKSMDTAKSAVYDAQANADTLVFEDASGAGIAEPVLATFSMAGSDVTVSAEFVSVFDEAASIDIASDEVKVLGAREVSEGDKKTLFLADRKYTGSAITPEVKLSYRGYVLTSSDYTVSVRNNKKVGTATVTITAKGRKFTGKREVYFNILEDSRTSLSDSKKVTIEFTNADEMPSGRTAVYYYNGEKILPAIRVTLTEGETESVLAEGTDYTASIAGNLKVGTATITLVAASDGLKVRGSVVKTFRIGKCPVSELTIGSITGATYTGSAIKPSVTVRQNGTALVLGRDYTLSYKNNTNPGTATVTVTGKGNYSGKTSVYPGTDKAISFIISARSIADSAVKASAAALVYTGKNLTPRVTLSFTGKNLKSSQYEITKLVKEGADNPVYDASAENKGSLKVKDTGSYTLTVEGKGAFKGQRLLTFKVTEKSKSIANAVIKTSSRVYTGTGIRLVSTVNPEEPAELTVTINGKLLKEGEDYKTEYENNTSAGRAVVKVIGTGDYAGEKSAKFTITKAKLTAVSSCTFEKDDIYGEERPYTGYAWEPELVVRANVGTAEKPVIRTLRKDVDYTIAFKNNLKADTSKDGSKKAYAVVTGKGGYTGKLTIKDIFDVKDTALSDFVISVDSVNYTGSAIKPSVKFVYRATGRELDIKAGTAVTLTYKNNKEASGKANGQSAPVVTVKEKGMNAGASARNKASMDLSFAINPAVISSGDVADISAQTYKGKAVKPAVTVKVSGKTLKAGRDYKIAFSGNDAPGVATVIVTGCGNYTGTVTGRFIIK